MTYPYPIPGSSGSPAPQPDNYFYVGNECCGGNLSKDVSASVKVYFDYSAELPAGVTVSSVTLAVEPVDMTGIGVSAPVLTANVAVFMVSGGVVGGQYVIEATAHLNDAQIWIDSIRVMVTDCDASASISNPSLLNGPGTVVVSSTLYYIASAGQTVFNLSTPDQFGQIGSVAGSNVIAYVGGERLMPVVDYTVSTSLNRVILVAPATAGEEVIFDLLAEGIEIPDAPSDGNTYGRQNDAWNPVLPLSGGTVTGYTAFNKYVEIDGGGLVFTDYTTSVPGYGTFFLMATKPTHGEGVTSNVIISYFDDGGAGWAITMPDSTPRSGGDTGANFSITGFSDTGATLPVSLTIQRSSGDVLVAHDPTQNLGVATKHYVDAHAPVGGPYLALSGGTMAGQLTLAGPPLSSLDAVTKAYVDAGVGGIITDAPNDGQYYSRRLHAWFVSPAGLTDADPDGTLYARKGGAWSHVAHTDITDWTASLAPYALISSVPLASSTTPLMDSAAAIGTGTTWARADHVHPTDTSRYSASNPANYIDASGAPVQSVAGKTGTVTINHSDITDWAVTLAPYALSANVLSLTGGTLTGPLYLSNAAGTARNIVGQTSASTRWDIVLGNTNAETGANTGSNFSINAFDDTGAFLTAPLTINRANGQVSIPRLVSPQAIGANRLINGDMAWDQRNAGVGGTASAYTCDRWGFSGTPTGKFTWQRISTSAAPGFPFALGCTSTSAYTPAAGDIFCFYQFVEANNVSDFQWGTASAQPVTLSFWAFSSLAGTFSGVIRNGGATRSYPFTFSIPVASTWTQVAVTIPGDITGTWAMHGTGTGVEVIFDLGSGSTFRTAAGAWVAGNYLGVTGSVRVVSTNGASFYITGVKLELGSIATPFPQESIAKRLADCQRYFQKSLIFISGYETGGSAIYSSFFFPVVMRAVPSVIYESPTYSNASALASTLISTSLYVGQVIATATGYGWGQGTASFSAEL